MAHLATFEAGLMETMYTGVLADPYSSYEVAGRLKSEILLLNVTAINLWANGDVASGQVKSAFIKP